MRMLCAGLNTLGVHEAVKKHAEVFRPIFVAPGEPTPLSTDTVEQTFKIGQLSEEGSNARVKELQVIGHWRDLLQDIEEELSTLKFEDILVFSTGGDAVPAIGFVPEPTLAFATDGTRFPRGKTCANVLELPIVHDTYHKFKEEMEFGILNSTGFGMA
ncbi:G2/M phase-specific E3 ubiquitin-protein ligase-like [Patiria miniata]|uniref:HECT domain-containing protein n=1 Tax=Patiria miniata TaxID=46514 RepID=A0A914ASF7_PATMI|nr:G2/M phase-specific E3 ubiquitin-protein ligase-like [Patiria miniata]